jgi:hypothetical protein
MDAKTRRTWAGLASYANGTATFVEIMATIVDCMGWVAATFPADVMDLVFTMAEDLPKQAAEYRQDIELVLRFLSSGPKSQERTSLRARALYFLREHGEHIRGQVFREAGYSLENLQKLNYSSEELGVFKEQIQEIFDQARYEKYHRGQPTLVGEDLLPLGLLIPSKGYEDFADPICDFLSMEYQKYLNREVSRRDKRSEPVVPIFVCPSCEKLVMPKRIGRRRHCAECSDQARAEKYRQRASPEEGRDYAWLYHLRKQESGIRKARLRQPKVRQRLAEIKSRQKNSRRCQLQLLALQVKFA